MAQQLLNKKKIYAKRLVLTELHEFFKNMKNYRKKRVFSGNLEKRNAYFMQ
jgi:hypothetical protein